MALTYNKQIRDLDIRGVITLTSGTQINLTASDIFSYDISEASGGDGLPLGTAEAASFALSISNAKKGYTPSQFDNAEVHMQIGIKNGSQIAYSDFGVWYVSDATAPEQSVAIDLEGYDALATLFEVDYADTASAYPTTLGSLATAICAAAGIPLKSSNFTNADISLQAMPEWDGAITLRKIIGYISACAGGFARIDRSGKLEIVSYASGKSYTLSSDLYTRFTLKNGAKFAFNAIEVAASTSDSEDESAEDYTRYAVNPDIASNPTNTIRVDANPLFTAGVANSVKTLLTGLTAASASVSWGGDPVVMVGDKITVNNTSGKSTTILIGTQSISFSGGLSFESDCSMPSTNTVNSGSYTSSGNVMDGNGNIKATRIANLDKTVISATTGHFENLTASTVNTDMLLAKIIEAVDLKAKNISTESVITDTLTSAVASIVEATVKKLNAGTITSDELYASFAELLAIKVGTITASSLKTDQLAAELARITILIAGTATFDRATIQHLVAEAMHLSFGEAGTVFVRNLAVEYAQMIGAAIGNLCIKASDGNYYNIDVNQNGNVTAAKATVSAGEIAAGQTYGGQVILETNITAANLSTGNLLATYALVNRIDAARIDVDELFAREAFIGLLRTSRIFADKSLEIIVGEADSASRVFRQEDFPDGDVLVKPGDMLVQPSTGKQYQAVQTGSISFALDENGDLYYDYAGEGSMSMDGFYLCTDGFAFSVTGDIGKPYEWVLVRDLELQAKLNAQAEQMAETVIKINKDIESIQDQLDGNITTWFEAYVPTNSNAPASTWTTADQKNQHLGDLFYVNNPALEENGYCYRWQQTGGTYSWVRVSDSGVTKALADAAKAQDTADKKRRVFVVQPTPPYDVGDLWAQGSGGDLMRCSTAKIAGQSYASGDWVKASKYTDDTKANAAQNAANTAQSTANNAQSAANGAQETADMAGNYANEALDKANNALTQAEFKRVVRVDDEGLHVGDNLTGQELLLASGHINVVINNVNVATYADKFVRLGNMQIRKVRGGLAISVYNG